MKPGNENKAKQDKNQNNFVREIISLAANNNNISLYLLSSVNPLKSLRKLFTYDQFKKVLYKTYLKLISLFTTDFAEFVFHLSQCHPGTGHRIWSPHGSYIRKPWRELTFLPSLLCWTRDGWFAAGTCDDLQ